MTAHDNTKPVYQDIDFVVYVDRNAGRLLIKVHRKLGFNCKEEKPEAYIHGENALILKPST